MSTLYLERACCGPAMPQVNSARHHISSRLFARGLTMLYFVTNSPGWTFHTTVDSPVDVLQTLISLCWLIVRLSVMWTLNTPAEFWITDTLFPQILCVPSVFQPMDEQQGHFVFLQPPKKSPSVCFICYLDCVSGNATLRNHYCLLEWKKWLLCSRQMTAWLAFQNTNRPCLEGNNSWKGCQEYWFVIYCSTWMNKIKSKGSSHLWWCTHVRTYCFCRSWLTERRFRCSWPHVEGNLCRLSCLIWLMQFDLIITTV